jgi:hypothetical protein
VEPFETLARAEGGSCILPGKRLIVMDVPAPLQVWIVALA